MTSFPAIKPQCIHHILHSSIDVNVGEGEDDVVCWAIAAAAIPMHTTKNALPAAVVSLAAAAVATALLSFNIR